MTTWVTFVTMAAHLMESYVTSEHFSLCALEDQSIPAAREINQLICLGHGLLLFSDNIAHPWRSQPSHQFIVVIARSKSDLSLSQALTSPKSRLIV